MKIKIDDIYNDNHNLFADNSLLNSDERLTDITALSDDLDLIVEMSYGAREIFKRYLTEDDDEIYKYNLSKIHKSVYATVVENLLKYNTLLASDDLFKDYNPTHQFYEHDLIGERVRENDIKSRVDTTTHGNVNKTNTHGDIGETTVHGTINTTDTNGQRVNTDAVTSFSSNTFKDTEKSTTAQVIDSEQITQGNDTVTTTHGNDTEQITRGQDTVNYGAHKDVITDTESVDEKYGYNDALNELEKYRRYPNRNLLNEIINDVLNGITYGVYTF